MRSTGPNISAPPSGERHQAVSRVGLLAQRILVLVLIASALAAVAAYFAVGRWLEDFAYRADINPLIFLLAAAAAAAVAFFTVAAQSWRTANADPVQSLRYV
jgi:putative ABC transport system permease protein